MRNARGGRNANLRIPRPDLIRGISVPRIHSHCFSSPLLSLRAGWIPFLESVSVAINKTGLTPKSVWTPLGPDPTTQSLRLSILVAQTLSPPKRHDVTPRLQGGFDF